MLKKTDIPRGSMIRVVPLGKLAEIHYNDNGVISGIYDTDGIEMKDKWDASICARLQKNSIIPSRLLNSGSCAVRGVFHHVTAKIEYIERYGVDNDVEAAIQTKEIENVEFYAFDIIDGKSVYGAYQVDTLLDMRGFNRCKEFMGNFDSNAHVKLEELHAMSDYPFISGYAIAENGKPTRYIDSGVSYEKINDVMREVSKNGYINARLVSSSNREYLIPYTELVRYNVQKNSIILFDEGVKFCTDRNRNAKKVDHAIRCEFCGATINVPMRGYVRCGYDNCVSNIYPCVENMLYVFGLNHLSYADYISYVEDKKIVSICDVMSLPEYADAKVSVTLSTLLQALCPPGVVRSVGFFDKLCESAKSQESIMFYLNDPVWIEKDMKRILNPIDIEAFKNWVSDPENLLIIKTFIDMDNISIQDTKVSLDVPTLFRNKKILLDGVFKHGSFEYVSSILKSYGADITAEFDNRCNCVIIGDLTKYKENLESVLKAGAYGIPVFAENGFFKDYGIDRDIENVRIEKSAETYSSLDENNINVIKDTLGGM